MWFDLVSFVDSSTYLQVKFFKASKTTKIVVLLFNGGPVDISWAVSNPRINSIIECFLPAQRTGQALLQVLYGNISPAGRLPYTWYANMDQVIVIQLGETFLIFLLIGSIND